MGDAPSRVAAPSTLAPAPTSLPANVKRLEGKDETDRSYVRYFTPLAREATVVGAAALNIPAGSTVMFQKIIHDGLVGHAFLSQQTTTFDLARSTMIFERR